MYVPAASTPADVMLQQLRSSIKQNSQDFKALKSALKSNDLAAATQAYNNLQQDIQNASQATGGQSLFDPDSPIGKDFQALGDALKSGDVSAAKQAFAAFRNDIKHAAHVAHARHHVDNDGDGDDGGTGTVPTTPTPTTASGGVTLDATA